MRTAAGICAIVLGGAGFAFASGLGTAVAGSLPTLTVTTVKAPATIPTVSVPKVTAPSIVPKAPAAPAPAPTAPKVSAPSVPSKVSAPSVPAPTQTASGTATRVANTAQSQPLPSTPVTRSSGTASSPAGGASSASSSSASSSVQTSGSSATGSTASGGAPGGKGAAPLSRLRASGPWLASHGRHARHAIVLTFRLANRSRVLFTATQVAPVCRLAGSFSVVGHPGINRVVFRGRINGRNLAPGTYKISARTPGKSAVLHVIVVIVNSGVPSPAVIALARKSDVCSAAARGLANSSVRVTGASGSGTRGNAAPASSGGSGGAAGGGGASSGPTSGTAGETFTAHSPAVFSPERISKNVRNPLVIFALGAAILLLGVAALPKTAIPDPRMTDVLVRHRVEVALAGAAALAAALIALMLG